MDDGTDAGDDRTLAYNLGLDRTMFWSADRKLPNGVLYVGAGAGVALFMCVVGFWIGRASAPAAPPVESVVATPTEPVRLPVPPADLPTTYALTPPVASPSYTPAPSGPTPRAARAEDPVVTVRPKALPVPAAPRLPAYPVMPHTPPPTVTYQAATPSRVPAQVTRTPAAAEGEFFPAMAEPAAMARPAAGQALVLLRNDDNAPVDVVVDGNGTRTAMIAPGASVPLNLGAGSYQFRASGKGANSIRSTMALSPNRTYRLVINRKDEAGRDVLVLIEPEIDGHSG